MSVHESSLSTQDVLNDQIYTQALQDIQRPSTNRTDSFQTKENTRRNSLQRSDVLPDGLVQSPPSMTMGAATLPSPTSPTLPNAVSCQRCSGDGEVAKPCRFCKASGKLIKTQSCADCEAEKNGCGNMNCNTCHGVGRVTEQVACKNCHGSGSGLKLTCGDCGGSGNVTPEGSVNSSRNGSACGTIPE